MPAQQEIIITQQDFEKLLGLVKVIDSETSELLEDELNRAKIVTEDQMPKDVVYMGSYVSFVDEATQKETQVQLVFPNEALDKSEAHIKVSVLAPVGAALIGLKVGQNIDWPLPNGSIKTLKVTSVKKTA